MRAFWCRLFHRSNPDNYDIILEERYDWCDAWRLYQCRRCGCRWSR